MPIDLERTRALSNISCTLLTWTQTPQRPRPNLLGQVVNPLATCCKQRTQGQVRQEDHIQDMVDQAVPRLTSARQLQMVVLHGQM